MRSMSWPLTLAGHSCSLHNINNGSMFAPHTACYNKDDEIISIYLQVDILGCESLFTT